MSLRYKFTVAKNSIVSAGDVEAVAAELAAIRAKHNDLTPRLVWEASKRRGSVLSKYFTEDMQEAAIKHWLEEAREIIQSVYVVIEGEDTEPVRWIHHIPVPAPDTDNKVKHSFFTVEEIRNSDTMRQQMLDQCLAEIENWRRKHEHLRQFFTVVDRLSRHIEKEVKRKKGSGRR